ncbi:MAG: glycosyltransferase family 2 protein [Bacteroidales bacterium]
MNRCSIVILNWNGRDYLRSLLPVLRKHSELPGVDIVVADNASTDESLEFLDETHPGIRQIRFEENHGFAGGYNRALAQLDSQYHILLNSDVEVTPGWLEPLLDFMDTHPEAGACAPKILDYFQRDRFEYAGAAGGFIDRYGYPFCRGRIFHHLETDKGQYDKALPVFWASGACLVVRSEAFREAGGLDEAFFAHMEEIDLCWRMQKQGRRVYSVPSSAVYHVGGGSLSAENPHKTYLNYRNNLLLLYKNLPPEKRSRILFIRKILDGISALRFLVLGQRKDLVAVFRAHRAYSGMKKGYNGTERENHSGKNDVIVNGIYPGSIVAECFLRGKRSYHQLEGSFAKNK